MPLPIDLQVLFTKVNEHSENLARNNNSVEHIKMHGIEKIHQKSVEADTSVSRLEEYSEEFTRINAENEGSTGQQAQQEKDSHKKKNEPEETPRSHLKEDGTGNFIDLID